VANPDEQPAADRVHAPDPQPATVFVTVEPEGLEDEDPAILATSRRHVPVVGRRVVAIPDSAGLSDDEAESPRFRFPDPEEFRR
jgi:hypothetical protein